MTDKELWEWCGFVWHPTKRVDILTDREVDSGYWVVDNKAVFNKLPDPGSLEYLGFLFKYAVPKLQRNGYAVDLCDSCGGTPWHAYIYRYIDGTELLNNYSQDKDPVQALKQAIMEVIEKEDDVRS